MIYFVLQRNLKELEAENDLMDIKNVPLLVV
jgi:hypothetical protein